jgi:hypothetical protein
MIEVIAIVLVMALVGAVGWLVATSILMER